MFCLLMSLIRGGLSLVNLAESTPGSNLSILPLTRGFSLILPEDFKLSFIINSTLSVDLLSPYDYNSVMHYESGSGHLIIDWHKLVSLFELRPLSDMFIQGDYKVWI